MNEEEAARLRVRLAAAVPDPPGAPGRAARVATHAHRRRRLVVAGAGVAGVAAAAAALVVPTLLDTEQPIAGPSRSTPDQYPIPAIDAACGNRAELDQDLPRAGVAAVWVRFCGDRYGSVFLPSAPDVVLVDGVGGLVDGWIAAERDGTVCRDPVLAERFLLQAGFEDGSVRQIAVRPGACRRAELGSVRLGVTSRQVFTDVLTGMATRLEQAVEPNVDPGPPLSCPPDPRRLEGRPPGPLAGFLIPLRPRDALLCRYQESAGPGRQLELMGDVVLTPEQGERLRVAFHSRGAGIVRCTSVASRPVYAVAMEDARGLRWTFAVDLTFCGTITSDFGDFGLSSPWLTQSLQETWRSPLGS